MILVDPLDMARTAQSFEPADVGFNKGARVAARGEPLP